MMIDERAAVVATRTKLVARIEIAAFRRRGVTNFIGVLSTVIGRDSSGEWARTGKIQNRYFYARIVRRRLARRCRGGNSPKNIGLLGTERVRAGPDLMISVPVQ